jgi:hypothetical protein
MTEHQKEFLAAMGCIVALSVVFLIADRHRAPKPIVMSAPYYFPSRPLPQIDVQGHKPSTETMAGCRDAGGTPMMDGERFILCYACTPGQAGTTCTRK